MCLISTIAQAPVLIVPLLHETGAFFFQKIRNHHNRFFKYHFDKITIVFTIL